MIVITSNFQPQMNQQSKHGKQKYRESNWQTRLGRFYNISLKCAMSYLEIPQPLILKSCYD